MTAEATVQAREREETRTFDVLVVGGGPAGLSAAEAAANAGARVAVLERQKEIGYPIHTSGGSWISDMRALGIPEELYYPIRTVIFLSPNRDARFEYEKPVCCVLDVRGIFQHLAARAVKAGAEIHSSATKRHALEKNAITCNR